MHQTLALRICGATDTFACCITMAEGAGLITADAARTWRVLNPVNNWCKHHYMSRTIAIVLGSSDVNFHAIVLGQIVPQSR